MTTAGIPADGRFALIAGRSRGATVVLALLGALTAALTLATPLVFRNAGDNGYIAMAIAAGLVAMAATPAAERAPTTRALWLIIGLAVLLRAALLLIDPLLSSDIYRYVWDGKVQAAGVNPYRYIPADPALGALRDSAVYPHINRADYAVTIYPPVAQMFFFLVTRLGENVTTMKLALLACEAGTVTVILLLLRRCGRPLTRIVAYAWHPLPMWEIANTGHIDALMVALMMLGLWLAIDGRPVGGATAVVLGALAKPFSLFALPAIWRPWDWKVPAAALATAALCYLPYLSVGWGSLGFLTRGYLAEESLDTGSVNWPLAAFRQVFGGFSGDFFVYVAAAALVLTCCGVIVAGRKHRSAETTLADTAWLLMAMLFLLSPSYPWYFLILTPFVALVGGAPLWAFSIGALLLHEEVDWDHFVPVLTRKTFQYAIILAALGYVAWRRRGVHHFREGIGNERSDAR